MDVKRILYLYPVCEYEYGRYSDNLSNMYGYFDVPTTWPGSLMVSVSDYGKRGPGSIPGWAHIIQCFLFLLVLAL